MGDAVSQYESHDQQATSRMRACLSFLMSVLVAPLPMDPGGSSRPTADVERDSGTTGESRDPGCQRLCEARAVEPGARGYCELWALVRV